MGINEQGSKSFFVSALPVWPEGLELEMNITAGFRAEVYLETEAKVYIKIAAASVYRFYINGIFGGHGPAVAAHGHYRVDEWDISEKLVGGKNYVAIEVVGYNANSYYLLDQPSFLQAEICLSEGTVLAATGLDKSFETAVLTHRIQKTQRYSFQRPFMEAYNLMEGYDSWRIGSNNRYKIVKAAQMPTKRLLQRGVKYPEFDLRRPEKVIQKGEIETGIIPEAYFRPGMMTSIGPQFKGYTLDELESAAYDDLEETRISSREIINIPYNMEDALELPDCKYTVVDFCINITGFIGIKLKCESDAKLLLIFDEILTDNEVVYHRGCINVIGCDFKTGVYNFETMEPYVMRYLKLVVIKGECNIEDIYIREYANPDIKRAAFITEDDRINRVFEAGINTFRQNALDIFMDCPSRERAGWLCDSYFAARTAFDVSGNTLVERNFIENFLLPEKFSHLPEGMLPMCYPSDHNNGNFIPNWALWFVLELEEYLDRSGDRKMIDALKPRVMKLFEYFKKFLNEYGLLEKLEKWVFVEWSQANKLVQDVNYPSNMLYAAALETASRLYEINEFMEQAEAIKDTIRKQSYNGEFFVDNAVREDGVLKVTDNITEVCQYYAFFFGIASPVMYPKLWNTLVMDFGPERKKKNNYPQVYFANAFIGNYLRLELLSKEGHSAKILEESIDFFYFMAERTGTLWEHDNPGASCNHGFASHIVHVFYRDILGVYRVDTINRVIKLRFSETKLNQCDGTIPVGETVVSLNWKKEKGCLYYSLNAPKNYRIDIENLCGLSLVEVTL